MFDRKNCSLGFFFLKKKKLNKFWAGIIRKEFPEVFGMALDV